MKLSITLNSSANLDTREGFAGMLRHIADTIEASPMGRIDTALYDRAMVRVGHLTLLSASAVSVEMVAPAQLQ